MEIAFYVFVLLLVVVVSRLVFINSESQVRQRLRDDRLEPISARVSWLKSDRYTHHIDFVAQTTEGRRVTGHAIKSGSSIAIFYAGDFDRLGHLRDRLTGSKGATVAVAPETDLETRILFETNQRLERLQGDRDAFLDNDLNADGVIDADEWDIVRERVAAEVRAELTGQASPKASVPVVVDEEEVVAKEVVAEEVEADGHW